MSKHTPGPWTRRVGWRGDGTAWSQQEQLCNAQGVAALVLQHDGSQEGISNACLAEAAPDLLDALTKAISVADEARREWDAAPEGMRAGKLLIALSGKCPRYRSDINAIHAVLRKAQGLEEKVE